MKIVLRTPADWGAKDDGKSLQKNSSGKWIAALPTPGLGSFRNSQNSNSTAASTSTTTAVVNTTSVILLGPLNSRYSPMPGRIKRQQLGRIWCFEGKSTRLGKKPMKTPAFCGILAAGRPKKASRFCTPINIRANTSSFLMFRRAIFRQATRF